MTPPERPWREGELFCPPTYIEWQMKYVARMYLMRSALLLADTGLGKTMMTLGVAGLALERDDIDHVLVVCEANKLREWLDDFGAHTRIPAVLYDGPRRKRLLAALPPAVIVTYETARNDIAVFPPKGSKARKLAPGPLMEALAGRRVMVAYDEVTKLKSRSSNLYKAHHWMVGQLRRQHPGTRVLGLTATLMDTDLENAFNEGRVVIPGMPPVKDFNDKVIAGRDPWNRPRYTRDGRQWLRDRMEPWMLRKRKSDPDVRDSFPPLTEKFRRVRMRPDQFRAYRALEGLSRDGDGERREVPGLGVLLRQLAGDPWAVLEAARAGSSPLAGVVASEMGEELQACSSAKAAELESVAGLVTSSGGKLIAFTFFGQTVLPSLRRRLDGFPLFAYHGQMPQAERESQLAAFRSCSGGAVLLASDAAARGLNIPEASVIVEYDVGRTHSLRQQRAGRGHRLGRSEPLTFITLILEGTIESESSIRAVLARNDDQDFMLGDQEADGYTTADDRREMFAQASPATAGAADAEALREGG